MKLGYFVFVSEKDNIEKEPVKVYFWFVN